MKVFSGTSALVGLITVCGIFTGCGAVNDQSFLLGARSRGGVDDGATLHHQEQEQEREQEREHRTGDDGVQHQERHRGGHSEDGPMEQRFKNPGDQTSMTGATIALSIENMRPGDDDTYKFEASGLPSGLSIDAASGQISGVISAAPGVYAVVVTAKETEESEDGLAAALKFNWNVTAQ